MSAEAVGLQREHVPQHATASLSVAVLVDGDAPVDEQPNATCHLVRADVVDKTITDIEADEGGVYRVDVDLATAAEGDVDVPLGEISAEWTFAGDGPGPFTQILDVVGLRVATLQDVNHSLEKGGDSITYPELERRAALQLAIDAFELEANQAFTLRERTETVYHDGSPELVLNACDIHSVTAIVGPDGTGDVAGLVVADDAILNPSGWRCGNYTVTYSHGLAYAPGDVTRAVALVATSILADGPWDDRGVSISDGASMTRLLTAGVSGASFSIPEVQAALNRHRNPWLGGA